MVTADAVTFLPHHPLKGGDRVPWPPHPVVSPYVTIAAASELGARTARTLV